MKVLKEVTETGTINHRDAFFKASLCANDTDISLIFAVAIRNPEDEISNLDRVKSILNGRVQKRFLRGLYNSKIGKFTNRIDLFRGTRQLCSKEAMTAMLKQFKRVKERDLAEEIGLKWNPKEGDVIKELSVESPKIVDVGYPVAEQYPGTRPILDV